MYIGYSHSTICSKHNFVDRDTGVHTQADESLNNQTKNVKSRK